MRSVFAAMGVLALAGCGTGPTPAPTPTFTFTAIATNVFVFTIPAEAKAATVEKAARDQCAARDFCKVFGWTDAARVARGFPMTDREAQAQSFDLSINRQSGMDEVVWDCAKFPQPSPSRCLSKDDVPNT